MTNFFPNRIGFVLFILSMMYGPNHSLIADPSAMTKGVSVRNGGKIVICNCEGTDNLTLYDFYEQRWYPNRNFSIDLGPDDWTVDEKVRFALNRFAEIDVGRAQKYLEWYANFNNEMTLVWDDLPNIEDDEPFAEPETNCRKVQAVIQDSDPYDEDPRYFIHAQYWNHRNLPKDHKAGLILHELIYREGIEFNVPNSIGVRYLTALLSSPRVLQLTQKKYMEILRKSGFKSAYINGVWVDTGYAETSFSDSGHLEFAKVIPNTMATTSWGQMRLKCYVTFTEKRLSGFTATAYPDDNEDRRITIGSHEFFVGSYTDDNLPCEQGTVENISVSGDFESDPGRLTVLNKIYKETADYHISMSGVFSFYGTTIGSAQVSRGRPNDVTIEGSTCKIKIGSTVRFNNREELQRATVQKCAIEKLGKRFVIQGSTYFDPAHPGQVYGISFPDDVYRVQTLDLPDQGLTVSVMKGPATTSESSPDLIFDMDTGKPRRFFLHEETELVFANGEKKTILAGYKVILGRDGLVASTGPVD